MGEAPDQNPEDHEFFWGAEGIRRIDQAEPAAAFPAPVPAAAPEEPSAPLSAADHRRYPRIDLKLPILYRILAEEPTVASTAVQPFVSSESDNISPSGACLMLAECLPKGAVLALSIHLEDRKKISAVGRVVWSQPTDVPHHFLTGLEFIVVYKKVHAHTEYMNADALQDLLGD
jgi:hypothetical protein